MNLKLSAQTGRLLSSDYLGFPIRGLGGDVTGFRGTARDITDRYRARQALLDSEERFRSIINTVVDGIITLNRQGSFCLQIRPRNIYLPVHRMRSSAGKFQIS